jgi:hypothetical protein
MSTVVTSMSGHVLLPCFLAVILSLPCPQWWNSQKGVELLIVQDVQIRHALIIPQMHFFTTYPGKQKRCAGRQ